MLYDSPEHADVLQAVGSALSNWSAVEIHLEGLFNTLSDMPNKDRATALFASILAFPTRMAVLDRLMSLEGVDELEAEMWLKYSARLSKFYNKRHELAHFSMNFDEKGNPVISPFLTQEKAVFDKIRHLSLNQIQERAEKFKELAMASFWFNARALNRRAAPPEPPVQANEGHPLVARLQELAIQSLEERKQPAK